LATTPSKIKTALPTVPVFYQGQCNSFDGVEPDHYISKEEFERGKRVGRYIPIHRGRAALKLTDTRPKFPEHVDSIKSRWKSVATNNHSFRFRRDYGALQQRTGPTVKMLLR
jgi:hypothetical protein